MDEEKPQRKREEESENVCERESERERAEKCANSGDGSVTDTHCS